MSDYFTNVAFELECTAEQAMLLESALIYSGEEDFLPSCFPSKIFVATEIYDQEPNDDYFSSGIEDVEYSEGKAILSGMNANPWAIAQIIRHILKPEKPVGFEWSNDCSKLRVGAFGGGWCVIFEDRVDIETTSMALSIALNEGMI